jgi:hypothetical protein
MFREDPAREILQSRYVHEVAVWLKVPAPGSSMILCDPWKQVQPILRIVTEGRTWWTLQAGDIVALIKNDRRQEHRRLRVKLTTGFGLNSISIDSHNRDESD